MEVPAIETTVDHPTEWIFHEVVNQANAKVKTTFKSI